MKILKPKLQPFSSERIYWAVEQVEREAGDIDALHLDDNSFYIKSKVDAVIAELEERVREERSAKVDYKISANDLSDGLRDTQEENRKLKRALWLARAAMCKMEKERWANHIDLGSRRNRKDPAYVKTGKLLTVIEWRELWANNELKCKSKAEVYK